MPSNFFVRELPPLEPDNPNDLLGNIARRAIHQLDSMAVDAESVANHIKVGALNNVDLAKFLAILTEIRERHALATVKVADGLAPHIKAKKRIVEA